jgi:hypothetical protein
VNDFCELKCTMSDALYSYLITANETKKFKYVHLCLIYYPTYVLNFLQIAVTFYA